MTAPLPISGFADEIADDLDDQLATLESLDISHLDLRGVWNENALDLSADRLDALEATLAERGFAVTSIGSPIGKIGVEDDFDPHLERLERALELANRFDTDRVRVFSYYIPDGDDPADHREEVLRRTRTAVEKAESAGVTLVLENEKDIYGDTPGRMRDLLTTIDSPHLRAVFDPANYLEIGVRPYPDALLQVVEYVDQVHVKDAEFGERGEIRPAGEGDGRIGETVAALHERGFDGPLSLEPHLAFAGSAYGYSGPEGFEAAAGALKDELDEAGVEYE
ncbi:sugar phosphate isomerase/epimerase family protein [Halosimplex halophilum]|uniref:sugar phosphate isomerase/epimerase family protein n=1 Tax=Halosimplex halophilum TaxID=2559572 RepID=UPI00107F8C6C|nr:sugar phosphate isomerase/epimerase family protein [Halosimplex halophilum]